MLASLPEPAQTQARMHHKTQARTQQEPPSLAAPSTAAGAHVGKSWREPLLFLDMSGTGEPHRGLGRLFVQKKSKVATPLHSNRMERQRHVTPFLGSHAAYQVSKSKEVEVAAASADEPQAWCPRSWQHSRNVSARQGQSGAHLSGAPSPTPPCDAFSRHVPKLKGAEVAAGNGVRGRGPGLVSACMAAPTKASWCAMQGGALRKSSDPI